MTDPTAPAGPAPTATDVERSLDALLAAADVTANVDQIRQILATGVLLGQDGTDRLDLKIARAALTEMRNAFKLFAEQCLAD